MDPTKTWISPTSIRNATFDEQRAFSSNKGWDKNQVHIFLNDVADHLEGLENELIKERERNQHIDALAEGQVAHSDYDFPEAAEALLDRAQLYIESEVRKLHEWRDEYIATAEQEVAERMEGIPPVMDATRLAESYREYNEWLEAQTRNFRNLVQELAETFKNILEPTPTPTPKLSVNKVVPVSADAKISKENPS